MMNDGEDNENAGLSDITAEQKAASNPSNEAAASTATAPSEAAPGSQATPPPILSEEGAQETPMKKIAHAAEVALHTTVKVTNDVASKVVQASAQAFDSTQNVVRRMSKKGTSAAPDGTDAEEGKPAGDADTPAEETSAAAATEDGEPTPEQPKESLWGKVRRASGTAAMKAAGAAQTAYKAAEPVGQKVADGAKSAYVKAKPVAESAAAKTSEGASAAWKATKSGTIRVVDRVRSLSGAQMAPTAAAAVSSPDEASLGETREALETIGEITSVEPAAAAANTTEPEIAAVEPEVDNEPRADDEN